MRERERHRALARIAAIRAVQRDSARQALFLAGEREREAQEASRHADAKTEAAHRAWREQLVEGFLPELSHGLAAQLIDRAEAGVAAQAHADAATEHRAEAEGEWHGGDARCRQADRLVDASRRALAHDREERALERLADCVAFAWSRR